MNNGPSHVVQTERLRRSCYLRNLSLFAALPRSLQLSRSALRPAPPTADSTPGPPRAPARRPQPAARRRRCRCEGPGGRARGAAPPAWQCAPGSLAVVSAFLRAGPVSKVRSWGSSLPIPYSSSGTKTKSTGGAVQPA